MKYMITIFYCTVFLFCSSEIYAQSQKVKVPDEKVTIFTDRNLYISGEKINFSAILYSDKTPYNEQSKVLYVDLIAADQQKILQKKYLLENDRVDGQISLPEKTITGEYYLRGYTKFMRNFSHAFFAYVLLKIVNPEKDEIVKEIKKIPIEIDSAQLLPVKKSKAILMFSNKQTYHKRDTISVLIRPEMEIQDYTFSLSVVPKFSQSGMNFISPTNHIPPYKPFPKESTGFSVSGKMIQSTTQRPFPFNNIYLSIKENKNLLPAYTDTSGRFNFTLDFLFGEKEIFISSDLINQKKSVKYLIDNDFAKVPKDLSFPKFTLNTQEKELLLKMARNRQISRLYYPHETPKKSDTISNSLAFYGRNFGLINFDDYILLHTLAEYFTEIDLPVKLMKIKNGREFRIRGTQSELFIYKPLLLLDWVEVQDAKRILSISPRKISHIEVIDSAYLRGNFIFGGIINFITQKSDFGGSVLPSSTVRLKYDFLSSEKSQPNKNAISSTMPDSKNTMFWKSGFKVSVQAKNQFKIIAGDLTGQYLILLRGVNKQGRILQASSNFEIK